MRKKPRRWLGWLLIPVVAGLPFAVFLASKRPVEPQVAPPSGGEEAAGIAPPPQSIQEPAQDPEAKPPPVAEIPATLPAWEPVPDAIRAPPAPLVAATPGEPVPLRSPALDWAEIEKRPERWPSQTRLKCPVDFPLVVEGKPSGSAHAPAGTGVRVVKITAAGVEIAYAQSRANVAVDQTTLGEQMMEAPPDPGQSPQPVDRPPDPEPRAKATGPLQPTENTMIPQMNWHMHTGAERKSSLELLKVIEPYTQADDSLEVSEHPEIYKGVTLMMPIREALQKLGLDLVVLPSKSPVSHPGIPFFFRPFPNRFMPGTGPKFLPESENYFNLLYIVTDAADRVLALEFVCENPGKMAGSNTDFFTYNFVLNRRKAVTTLKVRSEVNRDLEGLLVIETWLVDEPRQKCLENVRWYLPKRVANFIRHVIESRLDLPE